MVGSTGRTIVCPDGLPLVVPEEPPGRAGVEGAEVAAALKEQEEAVASGAAEYITQENGTVVGIIYGQPARRTLVSTLADCRKASRIAPDIRARYAER